MIDKGVKPFYDALPNLAASGIQLSEVTRFFKDPPYCPKAAMDNISISMVSFRLPCASGSPNSMLGC